MDKALTMAQAAKIMNVHVATVRREIERGNLKAFPVGRSIRIRQSVLAEFMRREVR